MGGSSGNELAGASVTPTGVPILNLPVSASSRQRLESVTPAGANHAVYWLWETLSREEFAHPLGQAFPIKAPRRDLNHGLVELHGIDAGGADPERTGLIAFAGHFGHKFHEEIN